MICDAIAAPFYVLDLSRQFRERVIGDFVSEYQAGRTPNPCVRCNSEIRWAALLQKAVGLGCEFIATGHYASIRQTGSGRWAICRGVDQTRDQSYVLWGLTQSALAKTMLPIGELPTVALGSAVGADGAWTLVVDDANRPQGWLSGADRPSGTSVTGDHLVPGGSLYDVSSGSLRSALDAALSSPSGQGVAVDAEGCVVGAVSADDVLRALADARREQAAA